MQAPAREKSMRIPTLWRGGCALLCALAALAAAPALATPPPPPPARTAPPTPHPPPPEARPPVVIVPAPPAAVVIAPEPPPPLPVAMRVIYAPFYAAGLVLRYGVYYVIVAPLEVLDRTLSYGVEGGVERGGDEK